MSKFNDSYERLYEYWSYGVAIDYNVEKQLDDWVTIHIEYTKLSNALDKACKELEELEKKYYYQSVTFKHCKSASEWRKEILEEVGL